jgi:hypothetical protein
LGKAQAQAQAQFRHAGAAARSAVPFLPVCRCVCRFGLGISLIGAKMHCQVLFRLIGGRNALSRAISCDFPFGRALKNNNNNNIIQLYL